MCDGGAGVYVCLCVFVLPCGVRGKRVVVCALHPVSVIELEKVSVKLELVWSCSLIESSCYTLWLEHT